MSQETHSIRVTRDDVTVEVSGSQEFVKEHFTELRETYLESQESSSDVPTKESPTDLNRSKKPSLAELYSSADIKYKRDAALLVGWFLEKVEDQDDFLKSEIEQRALQSKVELGANLSRDMSTLIEKGLLQEVGRRDGEKSYYLTRSGESYVEEEFVDEEYIN